MTSYMKVLDKEEKPVLDAIDQARKRVMEVLDTKEYAENSIFHDIIICVRQL